MNKLEQDRESEIYRDTGCHLHPSCLNCPRIICIYDSIRAVSQRDKHVKLNVDKRDKVKLMVV